MRPTSPERAGRATALACSECHTVPASGDVAHATGTGTGGARATVAFGTLARTGGITTAAYAGSTTAAGANGAGTCSNVYCHGNFKNGADDGRPVLARRRRCRHLRLLPRHCLPAERTRPARCLRELPQRATRATHRQRHGSHLNGAIDVDQPHLHLLPRHRGSRRAWPERT